MRASVKILLISIGSLLVISGGAIMAVGLVNSDHSTTQRTVDLSDKDVKNFDFDIATSNVNFIVSTDEKKIVFAESKYVKHEESFDGGTLKIKSIENKKWYEKVSFDWSKKKVDVYLPASELGTLKIKCSTGNIKVPQGYTFESVDVKLSTGNFEYYSKCKEDFIIKSSTGNQAIDGLDAKSFTSERSTGKLTLKNTNVQENISIHGSTGKCVLEKIRCTNINVKASTGKISINDLVTTGNISLKADTGDILFEKMDCGNGSTCRIDIETDTGDVEGSLLTGKTFEITTDTGKQVVPDSTIGAPICKVKTDTGDIRISIVS